MAHHLVSELDRKARLALRDEIVARMEIAEAALVAYANRHPEDADALPDYAYHIRDACLAGFGFCVEEVRTAQLAKKAEEKTSRK